VGTVIDTATLPPVCMAALAAAGALPSHNVDLTAECTTKIGAFEAKVTADKGRDSILHEVHTERLLL